MHTVASHGRTAGREIRVDRGGRRRATRARGSAERGRVDWCRARIGSDLQAAVLDDTGVAKAVGGLGGGGCIRVVELRIEDMRTTSTTAILIAIVPTW